MLETDSFKLDITDEKGNSLFDKDFNGTFITLTINEKINTIASFQLEFNSIDINYFLDKKNLILQYQSDVDSYNSYLGINSVVVDKTSIILTGFMTKWENFKLANTRFLADNLLDAIIATDIKDTVALKNGQLPNQMSGNLFQVNVSNLEQCLELCKVAAEDAFWSISKSQINLISQQEEVDFLIPSLYTIELYPSDFDNTDLTIGDSSLKLVSSGSYRNFYTSFDKDFENHLTNYILNKKREKIGFPVYLTFSGATDYPYNVGVSGNNPIETLTFLKKWIVFSVTHSYSYAAVESKVVLGGIL